MIRTPTPAPGEERSIAIAACNTRYTSHGCIIDRWEDPDVAREWLVEYAGLPPEWEFDKGGVARMQVMRRVVRAVLVATIQGETPDAADLDVLNELVAAAPGSSRLEWRSGMPLRVWTSRSTDAFARALAAIAFDAMRLVSGAGSDGLAACTAPGCIRLLLRDHNRRHWCSKGCGDRVRSARYHARHTGANVHSQ